MVIEVSTTPSTKYHRGAAKVTDWFGLRVRYFRKMVTGNTPSGEWLHMEGGKLAPKRLAKRLDKELLKAMQR